METSIEYDDYTDVLDKVYRAYIFKIWFGCALSCFFLVLLPVACFIIFWIKKNYNKSIIIQLVIIVVGWIIFTILDIMLLLDSRRISKQYPGDSESIVYELKYKRKIGA